MVLCELPQIASNRSRGWKKSKASFVRVTVQGYGCGISPRRHAAYVCAVLYNQRKEWFGAWTSASPRFYAIGRGAPRNIKRHGHRYKYSSAISGGRRSLELLTVKRTHKRHSLRKLAISNARKAPVATCRRLSRHEATRCTLVEWNSTSIHKMFDVRATSVERCSCAQSD